MRLSRYSLISFFAVLALAGCGGSSSTMPPPPTIGKVYVAMANENTVLRFAAGASGDARPEVHLRFEPTGPTFISLDVPHNRMAIVSNDGSPAVTLLDNASEGGPAPRVITGAATAMGSRIELCALDSTNDLLYVAANVGSGTGTVLVFGPASTIIGNIAPLRTFTTGFDSSGFRLDSANNRLFLGDPVHNAIAIFDNASTLTGSVAATRTISGAATQITSPSDMVLDNSGRLILSNVNFSAATSNLLVFANAGAANGNVAPVASSFINREPIEMAISPAGELYVVDGSDQLAVYGNVATASGAINPIRVIQGPDTDLGFFQPSIPGTPAGLALDPTR
jgi:hypothetical protein